MEHKFRKHSVRCIFCINDQTRAMISNYMDNTDIEDMDPVIILQYKYTCNDGKLLYDVVINPALELNDESQKQFEGMIVDIRKTLDFSGKITSEILSELSDRNKNSIGLVVSSDKEIEGLTADIAIGRMDIEIDKILEENNNDADKTLEELENSDLEPKEKAFMRKRILSRINRKGKKHSDDIPTFFS